MKNLIVLSDIKKFRQIYESFGTPEAFEIFVTEAQMLDIKPWLGDAFLVELSNQRENSNLTDWNKKALYGGDYTYEGEIYFNEGIRGALAYYAYARFLNAGGYKATEFGIVQKIDDFSRPVEASEVARMQKAAFNAAEALKLDVDVMLRRFYREFPARKCGIVGAARKSRIRTLGQ